MSTQQEVYAAGSKNRSPMLNKDNYVPWSSRLLRYTKSKPNGKTNDELTEKEVKQIEADDQAIPIILMGLPEDIYDAVNSCETAQEIWLRVQQMMKGSDIGIQDKRLVNVGNQNGLIVVLGIANPNANQIRNGNVVAARAKGNANRNKGNQIRCYNCRGLGHLARNCIVRPIKRASTDIEYSTDSAHVYESDGDSKKQSGKGGGTVDLHPATAKEKRIIYMILLYNNLAIEVEKVNTVK
ncbi:integrase, catalytic region, zinc finger, CCHC-type containing protein [Tanacetum coccineum]